MCGGHENTLICDEYMFIYTLHTRIYHANTFLYNLQAVVCHLYVTYTGFQDADSFQSSKVTANMTLTVLVLLSTIAPSFRLLFYAFDMKGLNSDTQVSFFDNLSDFRGVA